MKYIGKLLMCAIVGASGSAVAQSGPSDQTPQLSGLRGAAFIDTLKRFYPTPVLNEGQYDRLLKIDAIVCAKASAADAIAPSCTVKAGDLTLVAADSKALSPSANLFQFLVEAGAGHLDPANPQGVVAAATDVVCRFGGHGNGFSQCTFNLGSGAPLAKAPAVTLTSTSLLAEASRKALRANGLTNQGKEQYQSVYAADQVSCTAAIREFANDSMLSCSISANGQVLTPSPTDSITLYRLIAESGGAVYDLASNSYVATATSLSCANLNMHTDSATSCTYTLASRHPVLTHRVEVVVPEARHVVVAAALQASHARVNHSELTGGTSYTLSSMDCVNPSTTGDQISRLSCDLSVDGTAVQAATMTDTFTMASTVVDAGANRLDPVTLSTTQFSASDLSCYSNRNTVQNCHVRADKVFPL